MTPVKDERHAVHSHPDPLDLGVLSRPLPLSAGARVNIPVPIEKDELVCPRICDDQGRIRQENRPGDPGKVEVGIRSGGIDQSRLDLGKAKHVHIGDPHDGHARRIDCRHRTRGRRLR